MLKRSRKASQEEIFASYDWWDKGCMLYQITGERVDYIESVVNRVFGAGALRQQEILEIGCGGGLLCEGLARRGAGVVGIDPTLAAIQVARGHVERSGLAEEAFYEQGYAEKLPYADGSFSVIICLDVLEHVNDLPLTIKEIARVLAPGGLFIFDTINRTLAARVVLLWIGERFGKNGIVPGLHTYEKFIKPRELVNLMTTNGLKVRELSGFIPRGFEKGRLIIKPGSWFKGVLYGGYATKDR